MNTVRNRFLFFRGITSSNLVLAKLLFNNILYSFSVRNNLFKKWLLTIDKVDPYRLKLCKKDVTIYMRIQDIAIFLEIFQYQSYEFESRKSGDIIDLGGHIGLFSVFLMLKYNVEENIYIVEPARTNFAVLTKNIEPFSNIIAINKSISTDSKGLSFDIDGYGHNYKTSETNNSGELIPSIAIDELKAEYKIDKISILKMDIEGHEKEIFGRGNLNWLSRCDKIMMEIHNDFTIDALFSSISTYNFSLTSKEKDIIVLDKNE